jgi:predicted nucleotidyltransferase
MRISAPDRLASVLFGRGMRAILAQVFGHPDRRFFMREIARLAGAAPSALQRDLAALTGAGILLRTREGRQVYYQANARCPIFPELKGLVAKTFGVADTLREMLAPHRTAIDLALIYGSVASGEYLSRSDVDVLIVGQLQIGTIAQALLESEAKLARPISPTLYARDEFARKVAAGDAFLDKILRRPVVFLIGERDDLERLIERKSAKARRA